MAGRIKRTIKSIVKQIVPAGIRRDIKVRKARRALHRVARQPCGTGPLLSAQQIDLGEIWRAPEHIAAWEKISDRLASAERLAPTAARTDGNRGVNPGDRRAIFQLVHALQPSKVLEIGTNVGFSTLHIAAGMAAPEGSACITTVDISDVNDPVRQPWADAGTGYTPRALLEAAGFGGTARFVTDHSLAFLDRCDEHYDFIFLDGSHDAPVVYKEVPRAINCLNPGGVIMLHDFYPDLTWLWRNKTVIPGPCLAVERLNTEGVPLKVLPFGELPWPTKEGSNVTSLALLVRA